jgi:S1-C subfamily serine protease
MVSHYKNTGWVGIEYDVDKETGHWTIVKVIPGSPAEAAGIQPGDILFAMYGIELGNENEESLQALKKARAEWKPGQEVVYTLKRNGGKKEVTVTLGAMPADVLAQWVGRHMMDHAMTAEQVAKVDK